jgi:AcrR family transcriptional regulator
MNSDKSRLSQRKHPVQARSSQTLAAIFDACIAQLLAHGIERLTTTRVAQGAGVSVGTLYQYYPNKQALLAAALAFHQDRLAVAMEEACAAVAGAPLADIGAAVVDAVLAPRIAQPMVARALLAVGFEPDGQAQLALATQRIQLAVGDALAGAADARIPDTGLAGFMLVGALTGQVQALLAAGMDATMAGQARGQMLALAQGYLRGIAVA